MIETYRYPQNIGSDEYKNRQVIFECTKSPTRRNRGEYNEKNLELLGDAAKFVAKNSPAFLVANKITEGLSALGNTAELLGINADGYIQETVKNIKEKVDTAWAESPDNPQVCCGIMLPLPNQITDNASHKWEITKGLLGQLSDAGIGTKIGGKMYQGLNYLAMRASGHQYSVDPAYWQLYKGSEPRRFSMTYEFIPESHSEAESIVKIISLFKAYSSPRLMDNDVILSSPFFWQVHISNDTINNMISMDNVTITEVQVTYGADGAMSMFYDGMPKHINLTLSLQESQPPYRSDPTPATEKSHTNPTTQKLEEGYKKSGVNANGANGNKTIRKETHGETPAGTTANQWQWGKVQEGRNTIDTSQLPTSKDKLSQADKDLISSAGLGRRNGKIDTSLLPTG